MKNSIISEACHGCKFANLDRASDITIGDYWGVHIYEKAFYSECVEKGFNRISAVILNTSHGAQLYESIKSSLIYKESDIDKVKQRERITKRNSPQLAKRFFDEWIPLENIYFEKTDIKNRCDMIITI